MTRILHIETAGKNCSVALSEDARIVYSEHDHAAYSHATKLAIFIEKVLQKASIEVADLSAVSVSCGPGSYTGLRIGSSVAKGLCYGAPHVKLLAIPTLEIIAHAAFKTLDQSADAVLCPMIDARRMEVYTALFASDETRLNGFCQLLPTQAMIVNEDSFKDYLQDRKVLFIGDGAEKCQAIMTHPNAVFTNAITYTADDMLHLSLNAFENKLFQDVAYFEPFYLKDFVAGKPGKNVLERLIK